MCMILLISKSKMTTREGKALRAHPSVTYANTILAASQIQLLEICTDSDTSTEKVSWRAWMVCVICAWWAFHTGNRPRAHGMEQEHDGSPVHGQSYRCLGQRINMPLDLPCLHRLSTDKSDILHYCRPRLAESFHLDDFIRSVTTGAAGVYRCD